MKIGLGLYRNMLNRDNYRFAKQAGCSHIVAHLLVDEEREKYLASGQYLWTEEELAGLKSEINAEGLSLAANACEEANNMRAAAITVTTRLRELIISTSEFGELSIFLGISKLPQAIAQRISLSIDL